MDFFLKQVYPWMVEVSSYIPVLPFIVGLFLLRRRKSVSFRLLFLYVNLMLVTEIMLQLLVYLGVRNNIWVLHMATPLEFLILASLYFHSFSNKLLKKGIVLAAVAVVGVSLADAFWLESITQMNSTAKMVANTLLILLAILYFYKVANDLTTIYLDRDPLFLFSCSILIYKAGTTMSFAMFNKALAESYDAARICIAIILVLNIFMSTSLVFILRRTPA